MTTENEILFFVIKNMQETIKQLEAYVYQHDAKALVKASSALASGGKILHRFAVSETTLANARLLAKGTKL